MHAKIHQCSWNASQSPPTPASNPSRLLPAHISLATRDVVPYARKTHNAATVSTIVDPTDEPANAVSPTHPQIPFHSIAIERT